MSLVGQGAAYDLVVMSWSRNLNVTGSVPAWVTVINCLVFCGMGSEDLSMAQKLVVVPGGGPSKGCN